MKIDVTASHSILNQLFDITRTQYSLVSQNLPYWSVLAKDEFISLSDQDKIKQFYQSGGDYLEDFLTACDRNGLTPSGHCFELGCGVGRVTSQLSTVFDSITATDIDQHNLAICQDYLSNHSITNVSTRLIEKYTDVKNIVDYDCFYSVITLQHNTPPIQLYMLDVALENLKSNGIAYFQILTDSQLNGPYQFSLDQHLAYHRLKGTDAFIEMHALTEQLIDELAEDAGCQILEVIDDQYGGVQTTSKTFLLVKN